MGRKRARERNITQIFLDFAEDLLFLHPWAQSCRELNPPGRIPMVPGKTRCRLVWQNIFVHGSQTQLKKKNRAREEAIASGRSEVSTREGILKPSLRVASCLAASQGFGVCNNKQSQGWGWEGGR